MTLFAINKHLFKIENKKQFLKKIFPGKDETRARGSAREWKGREEKNSALDYVPPTNKLNVT